MKNLFRNAFAMLFIASLATSCDSVGDDEELNYGNGAYVTQFPSASKTAFFLKDENEIVYDYQIPVQLVGGNGLALDKDITVSFEKLAFEDDANSTADDTYTDAVQGQDFDFVNPSTTITIPAGSTFALIPIKVYSANLNDANQPVLVLNLTSSTADGYTVASSGNKSKIAVVLQAQCPSDLAGTYSNAISRLTPAGGPYSVASEIIEEIAPGEYLTQATGNFTLAAYGLTVTGPWNQLAVPAPYGGYKFKEVCGRVAVEEQNLFNYYSNLVQQTPAQYALSTVNPTTGVITIHYTVTFAAGNRAFRSTYTPL
jgi:hypothetical protein